MADLVLISYIGAPILLLLLEKPLGLITRITKYLDSMWIFKKGFSLYALFSFFIITGMWAYFGLYIPNLLSEHVNLITAYYGSGHYLSWIALMLIVTLYGHFTLIKGAYIAAVVYSVHELIWLIFDGIWLNQFVALFTHFYPLVIVLSFLGAGYFLAYRSLPRWKEAAIIVSVVAYDLVWFVADNWVVGVQNFYATPKTIYFNDPAVNLLETASWLLPAIVILLPTPKTFLSVCRNLVIVGLVTLGLQLGALGVAIGASWVEIDGPAGALLITYAAIQALVVFWAQRNEALSITAGLRDSQAVRGQPRSM